MPSVEIRHNIFIDTKDYIETKMEKDKTWAVDLDIICSSFLFCINIAIYKDNTLENNISYLNIFTSENNAYNLPLMIIINENLNHFNLVCEKTKIIFILKISIKLFNILL